MDSLSSSVSTIKASAFHSTCRELYQFKSPNTYHHQPPPHPSSLSSIAKANSLSNKIPSLTSKNLASPFFSSPKTSPYIHRKPASGYAAALLDIAQCNSSLYAVQKDVRKFSKLLRNQQMRAFLSDPLVGEKEKGQLVKEVARRGNFNKHLVGLLKMLIERNKFGMVSEVLEEFERVYDELSGPRLVWVSSGKQMEEDELFRIAKRVQKLSGAVKVTVRNLVDDRF